MGLKLNEHYVSVQGEGLRSGFLTQFVRFAGCNMRCPGWPCDTQHAIEPKLYVNDPSYLPKDLIEQVREMADETNAWNVCITGGEPFMQREKDLGEFANGLLDIGFNLEVFTNGSYPYPHWTNGNVLIMQDWKLPGSGEHATAVAQRISNAKKLDYTDGLKFVLKDEADFTYALEAAEMLREVGVKCQFWMGCAAGQMTEARVVELMQRTEMVFRLNVQVHKYIWPGVEKGI